MNQLFKDMEFARGLCCPAAETSKGNKQMTANTESFVSVKDLLGGTEPNQKVTTENIHKLPPGSVVRNGDGSRFVHLHDKLWLWCCDGAHCYGRIENMTYRLTDNSVLCHIP